MPRSASLLVAAFLATADGLVLARPWPLATPAHRAARAVVTAQEQFDTSGQQFDLLSLRSFRRDTILQYDSTNQSEPLRIALTLLGILFSLSVPSLASELRIGGDELTAYVAALLGTGISGGFFLRNRSARLQRMLKIDREYAMGDLRATYRGLRTSSLRELRGKRRVVVVTGSEAALEETMSQARVYRRRLAAADAVIVPVCSDGREGPAGSLTVSEAESKWLWAPNAPQEWLGYFNELVQARGLALQGELGAWIGLNLRGRTFGSARGAPRWDELLGTALQPSGDGFGEVKEVSRDGQQAAAEAAAAAVALGGAAAGGEALAAAEKEASGLLDAQAAFYKALTDANVEQMSAIWDPTAADDAYVSEVAGKGARVEPWVEGSNAFPPRGLRATDCDALVLSPTEGWTTARAAARGWHAARDPAVAAYRGW